MKTRLIKTAIALVLLIAGFGGMVTAERMGWLGKPAEAPNRQAAIAGGCPHGMPDARCPFCDESLIESMGFCREHGVPEALCALCWPDVATAFKNIGDWCGEHARPESQCELCNPGALAKYARMNDTPTLPAPEKDILESERSASSETTLRHLRGPNVTCTTQDLRVQFATPAIAKAAGIEVETVVEEPLTRHVSAPAELHYDATRHARLKPRTGGIVHDVLVEQGDSVEAGQILVVLDAAELSRRKAEHLRLHRETQAAGKLVQQLQAWHRRMNDLEIRLTASTYLESLRLLELADENLVREQSLMARGATSQRELAEARSAVVKVKNAVSENERKLKLFGLDDATLKNLTPDQIAALQGQGTTSEQPLLEAQRALSVLDAQRRAARDQLRVLGLTDETIQDVIDREDTSGLLPVTAPFAGIVIDRHITLGEVVTSDDVLFAIGDTSRMWAMLDVREAHLPSIRKGQPVVLDLAGMRGQRFGGTVTWIGTEIDRRTRTLKVRATVANPDGLLRAGMYGDAEITIHDRARSLIVPRDALQWDGCCNLVFVRHSDQLYEPRKVLLSHETDRFYVAASGLRAGEEIVTTGSFLMKTEIMKGNIGAGCCEVEPTAQ